MKKAIWMALVIIFGAAVMRADNPVTSRPSNGTDSVDWSQLGSDGSSISDPFSFSTALSVSGTGSYANTGAGYNGDQGQVMLEGSSWAGNFTSGDYLNWTQNDGAITLNFGQGYTQIGAQIMADYYGAFTAQICDNNDSVCFTENGVSNGNNDGSAIYIGIQNGTPITSVTFNVTSASNLPDDFTINQVTLGGTANSPVPEPSSLLLLGSGLAGLGGMLRRKFARG